MLYQSQMLVPYKMYYSLQKHWICLSIVPFTFTIEFFTCSLYNKFYINLKFLFLIKSTIHFKNIELFIFYQYDLLLLLLNFLQVLYTTNAVSISNSYFS